ncbi:MAG TPA: CBS and ACT domain-containing protein [Methylomirabilota bacterium]|jgi:acetoin utilization protein AcuB|nr:CBS and ACT domain-containing protein [Methylomirabilota bacterium]
MSLTVRDVMVSDLVTVRPGETARQAYRLMRDHRFRHLPVVENGHLLGILSDRDLRPVLLSPTLGRARVRELMSEDLTTVTPDAPVEEAASLLVVKRIGCLPVVDEGRLVGIVTETDLLAVLVELLGLLTQSTRLDVAVTGGPDAYERIVEIIRAHEGRIISVGAVPGPAGKTVFSVRLEPCDPRRLVEALTRAGFEVLSHRRMGG